jgi:hypothetical protein
MTTTTVKGRKRKVNYDEVVAYVAANPTLRQSEIAAHFTISQCRVSHICSAAGVQVIRKGRPIKSDPSLTTQQNEWEAILHAHGLGMERGLRLKGQRILYGYDPVMQRKSDASATSAN